MSRLTQIHPWFSFQVALRPGYFIHHLPRLESATKTTTVPRLVPPTACGVPRYERPWSYPVEWSRFEHALPKVNRHSPRESSGASFAIKVLTGECSRED